MAITFNFTTEAINKLPIPEKGKVTYQDTKEKGLSLYVTSNGAKSFFIRKRIKGRDERVIIGSCFDLKVEQARSSAKILKGMIASGKDPATEKRNERQDNLTFGQHFQDYMERYSKLHKKSWLYDEREVNRFLSKWFKRRMVDIKKSDVRAVHEKIFAENGLYQANRILERIRAIYNKAIEWGWNGDNPALGIKKYKEKSRDRFIQPYEMPHLLQALEQETNTTARDYFLILLLTGARKTNTLMMRWDEISWDYRTWRIPDTKNGEPVTLPLVDKALDILNVRKLGSTSPWVFPSSIDDSKHFVDAKKAWTRTLQRATLRLWAFDDPKVAGFITDVQSKLDDYRLLGQLFKQVQLKIKSTS
ncbi:integrase arm-type DNA-binding domain-containing protein [Dyadobacter sp. LJ53]|uniref:tyrosine-type recombinase/integrase n=1 Tax=Dyadobacter chenwenxiniae TaxID=2906456 RepID=UPI001F2AD5A3|nr:site-specific integrase [Dyadobacter chenwenxiniae]MCF0049563.1 integrase arm-type DNA-binding domain-containing protein [Dyadobacter chenwenxiniae]